jgi:xanthine dehydrogenase accessory factor
MRDRGGIALVTELRGGVASHRLQRSAPGAVSPHLRRAANDEVTLYESLTPQHERLWIFGAGHVGQALVRLLSELALFDITWIDSRPEFLPADLANCVTTQACASPIGLVGIAPAGTRYVVLTHDHALDYDLCRSILRRADSSWLGLIGSASKAARFRSRLLRDGISGERLSGLTCPIGIPGIASKLPASIAIAISAQLLQQVGTVPATPTADTQEHACSAACGACGSERRTKP